MGLCSRAVAWIRRVLKHGADPEVVRRYALPRPRPVTSDDVQVCLDRLVLRVKREVGLDIPFEVTVVVPRAEITRRYRDGKLTEEVLAYSSITISHSPRPGETGRTRSP